MHMPLSFMPSTAPCPLVACRCRPPPSVSLHLPTPARLASSVAPPPPPPPRNNIAARHRHCVLLLPPPPLPPHLVASSRRPPPLSTRPTAPVPLANLRLSSACSTSRRRPSVRFLLRSGLSSVASSRRRGTASLVVRSIHILSILSVSDANPIANIQPQRDECYAICVRHTSKKSI